MTCDKDKNENVVKFIAEARGSGIGVLPPGHQRVGQRLLSRGTLRGFHPSAKGSGEQSSPSPTQFVSPPKKVIRFGLGAVKGVGEGAVEVIKTAREQGGRFLSMFDFCKRVDGRKVNRKVIEALVKAGAFDGVAQQNGVTRARVFGTIGLACERAAEAQRDRESGQTNLLALFGGGSNGDGPGPAAMMRGQVPRPPTNGCRRSCSPSRRRRSASTSAATRSTATPARFAATRTPPPRTASRRASAPR